MSDDNKFNLGLTIFLLFVGVFFLWRIEVVDRKKIEISRDYWMNSSNEWRQATMWWINYCRED